MSRTKTNTKTIKKDALFSKQATPSYIIDESQIIKNLYILQTIKNKTQCEIYLALKAFAMPFSFNIVRKTLDGCSASSINEAKLGASEFQKKVSVYSPSYELHDLHHYCDYSDSITFNSCQQVERFQHIIKHKNPDIKIGLRLNPEHTEVKKQIYNPCQPFSRFGVTKKELNPAILKHINGILIHALCESDADAFERLVETIEAKFSDLLYQIDWLNLGGGQRLTAPNYDIEKGCQIINKLQKKYNLKIILEPGEAVIYKAGYLSATVTDIIKNEKNIAILNTSAITHMPDVIEMPYRPNIIDAEDPHIYKHSYLLGGCSCISGDIIGEYSFKTPLQIGQTLLFKDMAQYTMVKNTSFNGINLPNILYYDSQNTLHDIKHFNYEDYIRKL